jgi:hypothetical protein
MMINKASIKGFFGGWGVLLKYYKRKQRACKVPSPALRTKTGRFCLTFPHAASRCPKAAVTSPQREQRSSSPWVHATQAGLHLQDAQCARISGGRAPPAGSPRESLKISVSFSLVRILEIQSEIEPAVPCLDPHGWR